MNSERRQMAAALARLKPGPGVRYWLNRNPQRKKFGLSAGWGEVEYLRCETDCVCPYVRDCTDGDEYAVDPRDLRTSRPRD